MITRADTLVIAATLLLLPTLFLAYWGNHAVADTAHIMAADGREFTLPLDKDRRLTVNGPLGATTLEIHHGKIRFIDSPCRGKQCIHSGWLSRGGDFAACLPNRISITLSGQENRFDSINF